MITLDGAAGEGGGQILRTALALSACTGQPFAIERIRAGRRAPGLREQHLTAVRAAGAVCGAAVRGAELGAQRLQFEPGEVRGEHYRFAVATAGSATLVLQTVLPPLLRAAGPSAIEVTGGTHNPAAPPFDFLARCFAPALARCGLRIALRLRRAGFYPVGGGQIEATIEPSEAPLPLALLERGPLRARRAIALVARLPRMIAERELRVLQHGLGLAADECEVVEITDARGPGNALLLEHRFENVTEIATGFGERGVRAEAVARGVLREARAYLTSDAPVGEHLADQLVLPLALARGGTFRAVAASPHLLTNADVVRAFLGVEIDVREETGGWRVTVGGLCGA